MLALTGPEILMATRSQNAVPNSTIESGPGSSSVAMTYNVIVHALRNEASGGNVEGSELT